MDKNHNISKETNKKQQAINPSSSAQLVI
ncbi:hypothetical protein CMUST_07645 [Corynebacterium mustelae]|uniref:Uncharacterized protein n=1 Tax=Corynebacterium mustelae TaxID=571915 RepID=A0A0G3H209_9CORY|nr:hypothetical protein CMUST_07645 [Corynebacterium mustelae]